MSASELSSLRPFFGRLTSHIHSTEIPSANVLSPLSYGSRPITPSRATFAGPSVTYHSNQLGLFDAGTENPLFTAAPPKLTDAFPHLDTGISDGHQRPSASAPRSAIPPPPKRPLRVQDYERVGGWTKDNLGRDQYIETGHIEEVGEDEDVSSVGIAERSVQPLPATATPPPRPILHVHDVLPETPTAFPIQDMSSSINLGQIANFSSVHLSSSIREPKTPASNPGVSKSLSSQCPPQGNDTNSGPLPVSNSDTSKSLSSQCLPAGNDTKPDPPPPIPQKSETENVPPATAHSDEPIVEANILTIEGLSADVEIIRTGFTAISSQQDVRQHIDMCTRIVESLFRVQNALMRRRGLPQEHWDFFSTPSRSKYEERLHSLQRCLRRLGAMSQRKIHLESSKLGDVLKKLEEHYQKLTDVADKLDATFDRLKLRYLYTTASRLTEEANHSRSIYLAARELYLRRRSEGTRKRSGKR